MQCPVPRATLGRLPAYLQFIESLPPGGNVSATAIAHALGLGDVQVRKDLSLISGEGRPKVGYETDCLKTALEIALGRHDKCRAVIVGAGKLGRALLSYNGFSRFGVEIASAFDVNTALTGSGTPEHPIRPMEELEGYCQREGIRIGILTVPQQSAQAICDRLIRAGITAVWSFAPVHLKVPRHVSLLEENLALSLAHLCTQIHGQNKEE